MLVFDLSACQPLGGNTHGGGEYARAVFRHLLNLGQGERLIAYLEQGRAVPADLRELIECFGVRTHQTHSVTELQSLIDSEVVDRFFSALPYRYHALDFRNVEVVMTIHGLRPIEAPTDSLEYAYAEKWTSLTKWMGKQVLTRGYVELHARRFNSLVNAACRRLTIVVPSEFTRKGLETRLRVPSSTEIRVLYSPVTQVAAEDDDTALRVSEFGVQARSYFLIVSSDRWIKNSYRALKALMHLKRRRLLPEEFKIVATGGLSPLMRRRFGDDVIALPYVDPPVLRQLYANAFALIYPTLNEGFGYPPLEAMGSGTPVLASKVCSIPEIAGDAPIYFSPFDDASIRSAILRIVSDDEVWKVHQKSGLKRAQMVAKRQRKDLDTLCELLVGNG